MKKRAMDAASAIHVVHQREAARYEIYIDNVRGGFADYDLGDGVMTFTHTFTDPAMRGNGMAGRVVKYALEDARAAGLRVVPQCWYVAQFIDRHTEYRDLLGTA